LEGIGRGTSNKFFLVSKISNIFPNSCLYLLETVQQKQYDHINVGGETIYRWLIDGGIFPKNHDEKLYGPAFVNRRQQQQSKRDDETMAHNSKASHQEASYQEQRINDDVLWLKWIAVTLVGAIFAFSQ
jgi:hypothetical protein